MIKVNEKWPVVAVHFQTENNDPSLVSLYEIFTYNIEEAKNTLDRLGISLKPIIKEWGIFREDVGPLANKLWDEKTANKMITLFRKGLVKGFPIANYQVKNIKHAF